jgi:hypothetical protein
MVSMAQEPSQFVHSKNGDHNAEKDRRKAIHDKADDFNGLGDGFKGPTYLREKTAEEFEPTTKCNHRCPPFKIQGNTEKEASHNFGSAQQENFRRFVSY